MKKIVSIVLSLMLLMSMSVTAFAESITSGTQTVSVTIPDYEYTLNIPSVNTIEYNNTDQQGIGEVTVTIVDSELFRLNNKTVQVTANPSDYLENEQGKRISCEISCMHKAGIIASLTAGKDNYLDSGVYGMHMFITVDDWSQAVPGTTYSTTITYGSFVKDAN